MGVNDAAVKFLSKKNWRPIKEIEKKTGCVTTNTPPVPKYQKKINTREIGLQGTRQDVQEAKKMVLEKLSPCDDAVLPQLANTHLPERE